MTKRNGLNGLLAAALLAAGAAEALVAPNPASLLSTKKVLIVYGTDATNTEHGGARVALNAKLNQIRSLVGFQRDSVNGSASPSGTGNLDQYDIIVFNYWFHSAVSQQSSFQTFANNFKNWANSTNKRRGWLGMHTSGANEVNEWNWFRDSVTAMGYRVHTGGAKAGTIRKTTVDSVRNAPIMAGLPDTVRIPSDEWYDFSYVPLWSEARVMYYLDESSLPSPLPAEARMDPHPSTWYREAANGNRFFYSALVHNASGVNLTAGNDFFASMMLRALEYLAGYQTTSIRMNGQGMYDNAERVKGVRFIKDGKLRVESAGPHVVQLLDLNGRRLFRAAGRGGKEASYAPDALRQRGMYVVRVSSGRESYTQRVMVP